MCCTTVQLTPITNIINLTLKSSIFQEALKLSHVHDSAVEDAFIIERLYYFLKPFSNINFESKFLEEIIAKLIPSACKSSQI